MGRAPVTFHGRHFQVEQLRLSPPPVQKPRIPIWVGGDWKLSGVKTRVARWDGCCVYKGSPDKEWQDITPADVHDIRAAVGRPGFRDSPRGARARRGLGSRAAAHPLRRGGWGHLVERVGKTGDRQRTIDAVSRAHCESTDIPRYRD